MTTYKTMRDRIADELVRDDLTTEINRAIVSAIHFYERERFWFNEHISTATTTNGTEYVQLPSDFIALGSLKITVNSRDYPLTPRTFDYIERINWGSTSTTGYPQDYAIFAQQVRLWPIPNDAYTLTMSYYRNLGTPSSDNDTSAWFVEAEQLIRFRAKWDLFANVIRTEPDEILKMKQLEQEELKSLKNHTGSFLSTGRIIPTSF